MNGLHELDRFFGSMDLFRNRYNRMLNDLDSPWWFLPGQVSLNYPRTNLYEIGDLFELEAEVPGFAKKDLNIKIQGNYLELSGERRSDTPEGYTPHRLERQAASFSRSFTLPADIDHDKVEATLKDGILTLKLPKAEIARARQININ